MVERKSTKPITIERQWFIDSRQGNIKDEYYFEKKLGSGGYGAVYLAKHKKTGVKVAVKAMQKGRIQDYEAF
jgi:calcium-dependent protein kinase